MDRDGRRRGPDLVFAVSTVARHQHRPGRGQGDLVEAVYTQTIIVIRVKISDMDQISAHGNDMLIGPSITNTKPINLSAIYIYIYIYRPKAKQQQRRQRARINTHTHTHTHTLVFTRMHNRNTHVHTHTHTHLYLVSVRFTLSPRPSPLLPSHKNTTILHAVALVSPPSSFQPFLLRPS